VVYFASCDANGLHYIRSRRFRDNKLPVCVTVLHGSHEWGRQGMGKWPETYDDVSLDFRERYTAEHCDFVAAPSQYILDWARNNGWRLPPEDRVRVLALPFFPEVDLSRAKTDPGHTFERLVFFGRLDMRKGIDLFVEGLIRLHGAGGLKSIREIVLLGASGLNPYGSAEDTVERLRSQIPDVRVAS
jgi:glycosyltransferase involved in cell wall biosynthesis